MKEHYSNLKTPSGRVCGGWESVCPSTEYSNCNKGVFCDDAVEQSFDQSYYSVNQALAGAPNPKTYVQLPEMVFAQPQNFEYWTPNQYISNGAINSFNDVDLFESGACQDCPAQSFNDWTLPQYLSSDQIMDYTKTQPINANMGISMTPGFANFGPMPNKPYANAGLATQIVDYNEIYDPRQNGYSSSDRCYNDQITGQPRYYYDDIEGVRRPENIRRNIVDQLDHVSRNAANASFIDRTNDSRTELMESLMRKRNSEMWQLREAPLSRAAAPGKSYY